MWAGIVFIFLTTGISGPRPTPLASEINLGKEELAAAHGNHVKQMQQTLRDKGYYRGKVDGVIGLRTRAGIRAYQKAENLPVTELFDSQTAAKLGVGPESSGRSFKGAGQKVGEGSDRAGHETAKSKPSACIRWTKGSGRTSKTRKEVKTAAASESTRGDHEKRLQAENENHPP
jgi:peptidoglycan hydrolase-like protein with peptidoglycan-binding domain